MSLKAISIVINEAWDSPTDMLVAIAIANYTGARGLCFAHYSTIAKFSGYSEKTVGRSVRGLIESGRVGAYRKKRGAGTLAGYVLEIKGAVDERYRGDDTVEELVDAVSGLDSPQSPDSREDYSSSRDRTQSPRNNQRTNLPVDSNQKTKEGAAAQDLVITAFEEWNKTAELYGFAVAQRLTDGRRKQLVKRLGENGIDGWRKALLAVGVSKFLRGMVKNSPFTITIDFLLQPSKFQKTLEGGFGQDAKPLTPDKGDGLDHETIARVRLDKGWQRELGNRWRDYPQDWDSKLGPPPGASGCILSDVIHEDVLLANGWTPRQIAEVFGRPSPPPAANDDTDVL